MNSMRDVFEIIYFITAGPILTCIALFGLQQLKIAKDTAKMSAKRESYRLASEQCFHYISHIIPSQDALNKSITDKRFTYFEESEVIIDGDSIQVKYPNFLNQQQFVSILGELLAVINQMEGFAVFFISGVADESIAFSSVGHSFCSIVRTLLPGIKFLGGGKEHYINLLKLFLMWDKRINTIDLLDKQAQIAALLKKVDNKPMHPLGTD